MKVILLVDDRKLGKKGDIIEVADGYANNFLIKNKKAVAVSSGSLKVLKKQEEDAANKEAEEVKKAEELKEQLKDVTLVFPLKVGKEGKAFGSVSTKQITESLEKNYGLTVDKKKFVDSNPLTELGLHNVKIELHKGVTGEVKVRLVEE